MVAPRSRSWTSIPTGKRRSWSQPVSRTSAVGSGSGPPCPALGHEDRVALLAAYVGIGAIGGTGPVAPSSGPTTASSSSPTTAPSRPAAPPDAHHRMATPGHLPRLRHAWHVADAGSGNATTRRSSGPRSSTVRWFRTSPTKPRTSSRWRTASATSCSSTRSRRCTSSSSAREPRAVPHRRVAEQTHRAIAGVAGHRALAEAMTFVDHGPPISSGSSPSAGPNAGGPKNLRPIDQALPLFSLVGTPRSS